MKIAVNTRLLLPGKLEGIGRFAEETLKRLVKLMPEAEFHFLFDRSPDPMFKFGDNVKMVRVRPQARHPILYTIWFDHQVAQYIRRNSIDMFFSPDGYLSQSSGILQIPVIHDLNFEHRPEDLPSRPLKYYKRHFPIFARTAARIATVSEFSKKDIVEQYGVDPEKIDVVYNAAKAGFTPIPANEKQAKRDSWSKGKPYILSVGSMHPRKNLPGLLDAYELLRARNGLDCNLVLVGTPMWKRSDIAEALVGSPIKDSVLFTGRVTDAELQEIYQGAEVYVFPSFFEGFGIPILEAMASGVPVLASKTTSLPEVGGEAAKYFHPERIEDLADLMLKVLTDENMQKEMRQAGLEQAKKFSWDDSAQALKACILKAFDEASV